MSTSSLNKVFLMGNLTQDPDLRGFPNGQSVCELRLAVNRRFTNANGQEQDEVCFVDVVVWGKSATNCRQFLTKGSLVLVEGRLQLDTWEDRNGGGRRSKLRVVSERVQFLSRDNQRSDRGPGGYRDNGGNGGYQDGGNYRGNGNGGYQNGGNYRGGSNGYQNGGYGNNYGNNYNGGNYQNNFGQPPASEAGSYSDGPLPRNNGGAPEPAMPEMPPEDGAPGNGAEINPEDDIPF